MTRNAEPEQVSIFRRLRARAFLTIALKIAMLALLYALFFSPAHRPHIDAGAVAEHIFPSR